MGEQRLGVGGNRLRFRFAVILVTRGGYEL